jgi:hypothetical protein
LFLHYSILPKEKKVLLENGGVAAILHDSESMQPGLNMSKVARAAPPRKSVWPSLRVFLLVRRHMSGYQVNIPVSCSCKRGFVRPPMEYTYPMGLRISIPINLFKFGWSTLR